MCEIWKDIPGYEGYYQVSNNGLVKSLTRSIMNQHGSFIFKGRILKNKLNSEYHYVKLSKLGKEKSWKIHRLVIMAFNGESELIIDHINGVKTDNRIENLRYCTSRENVTWHRQKTDKSSKYTGVYFYSKNQKWRAQLRNNKGKKIAIGYFETEEQAKKAFDVKSIELQVPIIV